jgi:uncharacterized repeat protein (TIGR03803 family)
VNGETNNGLLQGSDGSLYGVTSAGGATGASGTVFRVSTDGHDYAVLHSFVAGSGGSAPFAPWGSLVEVGGTIYGTTLEGDLLGAGTGTVFQFTADGSVPPPVLFPYGFGAASLSQSYPTGPTGPLVVGHDGALYGASNYNTGLSLQGFAIYKVILQGGQAGLSLFAAVYINPGEASPLTSLVEGGDGTFYGTTFANTRGTGVNRTGVLVSISADGLTATDLHDFGSTSTDGFAPTALVLASDGKLYGTTQYGGEYGGGTVFRAATNGDPSQYTVLASFQCGATQPVCNPTGLTQGIDGKLYGTLSSHPGGVFKVE